MVGGPSQMDLYDYKPKMNEWYDKDLPDSVRMGQRLTTMTSGQARFPDRAVEVQVRAARQVRHVGQRAAAVHGEDGRRHVLHPHACTPRRSTTSRPSRYMQTGNQVTGRPCLGAWARYGLGSLNENLPTFVVLVAKPTQHRAGAGDLRPAVVSRLPARRARGRLLPHRRRPDPVHQQPARRRRATSAARRSTASSALNELNYQHVGDPRDAHAHPAVRAGLPHAGERAGADRPRQRAGIDVQALRRRRRRSPARSPTRRCWPGGMVERGVRFVQIYHNNWDTHGNVAGRLPDQCRDVDQAVLRPDPGPEAARPVRRHAGHLGRRVRPHDLLAGRPVASRTTAATTTRAASRCGWPAAASRAARSTARPTTSRYNIVKDPVHIRDFHATVLHLLGFDHERFTYRYQGLDQKLTGVEPARVVRELIA